MTRCDLIDTHAHLNFISYQNDLRQTIDSARDIGVGQIVCVSSNIADSIKAIEIAKRFPGIVFAAVGIHPQQTDPESQVTLINQIKQLKQLATNKEVVAIGECGLDYSPAPPEEKDRSKKEQFFLFEEQIKISQELGLPLITHSRKAFADTLVILGKYKKLRGVFHCYAGGKKAIEKVLSLGWYFGLAGNLTYDEGSQNVARQIPLEKIILETDSPFLSPQPYRGLRNEPKNVRLTAEFLAKLKRVTLEEVSRVTSKNARELFRINGNT